MRVVMGVLGYIYVKMNIFSFPSSSQQRICVI